LNIGMELHMKTSTHIAVNPNTQGIVVWLEKVTDKEYNSIK